GLRPRDILVAYDGNAVADQESLGAIRKATEAAITGGKRGDTPIPLEVWRDGETLHLELQKGLLGVQIAAGSARVAYQGSCGSEAEMQTILRGGDLERIQKLPPLRGAKAEAEAIVKAWRREGQHSRCLLGTDATEPAVFELAAKAKY